MGYTKLESIRRVYRPGDRIELVSMEDAMSVPPGTQGTVEYVDDGGNVHMVWDNGSTLSFLPDIDKCKRLK